MAKNKLKQVFEKEGISTSFILRYCPVSKSTIRRVLHQRRTFSPSTQRKFVEAINRISDTTYSIKDLFPRYTPRAKKGVARKKVPPEAVTKAVHKEASEPPFQAARTDEIKIKSPKVPKKKSAPVIKGQGKESIADLQTAARKAAAAFKDATQKRFRSS